MMEDGICEFFEPLKTLDLSRVPACVDKPKSSELITFESPNLATEPESSPILASVTCNVPRFSGVFMEEVIQELTQVQDPIQNLGMRSW